MTQPNDPRKVKVIVELIDHTTKIAEANDRGDLVERLKVAKDRITDPQIRVVVAGHLKQGKSQLLNSLLNMPVARVGDDETTVLATVVPLRRAALGAAHRRQRRRGRARRDRDSARRSQQGPAAGAAGRRSGGAAGRGRRTEPAAQGRAGVRRHPRCRRTRPAAPVGHAGPDARRRRHADAVRHQPGVHRARDDVHPAGPRNLPGGNDYRDEDRSLSALARDRRGQRRSPATGRYHHADDPGVVAAAQPRHPAQRQGTQRGVQLPGHREVPQREGAVPGERPDPRPGAR